MVFSKNMYVYYGIIISGYVTEILKKWNPDEPRIPSDYGQYASLKTFDYQTQYEEACIYRYGVPQLQTSSVHSIILLYALQKYGSAIHHPQCTCFEQRCRKMV